MITEQNTRLIALQHINHFTVLALSQKAHRRYTLFLQTNLTLLENSGKYPVEASFSVSFQVPSDFFDRIWQIFELPCVD